MGLKIKAAAEVATANMENQNGKTSAHKDTKKSLHVQASLPLDYINLIDTELEKTTSAAKEVPDGVGMFRIKSANQSMQDAASRPDPDALYEPLWYENQVACLFADTGVGKSIYSVQIATHIAKRQKVLYFDFELSDKQFQKRYTDDNGNIYKFPENLYRIEIDPDAYTIENFEDTIIRDIENTSLLTGAKVLIIDNLTYLSDKYEKGDSAGELMKKLMALKHKYGLSVLVISHTPKRGLSSPITENDMAGSKRLINFFDRVFTIGRSAKDEGLRYIKQVKTRDDIPVYNKDNILVVRVEKEGSFLKFKDVEFATEREHLREPTEQDEAVETNNIKELISRGKSYRDVATELGISLAKVQRTMRKCS